MPQFVFPGPLGWSYSHHRLNQQSSPLMEPPPSQVAAFPNIDRHTLYEEVRDRMMNPWMIDQAATSLCGCAVVLYLTAKYRPGMYSEYVINLYETGDAMLGNLRVTPGKDCKNYTPVATHGADWVGLAGLRDSENSIFDYDEEDDRLAGINFPREVHSWFESTGFTIIDHDTDVVGTNNEAALRKAADLKRQGFEVVILLRARWLQASQPVIPLVPDHWVVLTSDIDLTGPNPVFTCFSWGNPAFELDRTSIPNWRDYWFGYIAVQP